MDKINWDIPYRQLVPSEHIRIFGWRRMLYYDDQSNMGYQNQTYVTVWQPLSKQAFSISLELPEYI